MRFISSRRFRHCAAVVTGSPVVKREDVGQARPRRQFGDTRHRSPSAVLMAEKGNSRRRRLRGCRGAPSAIKARACSRRFVPVTGLVYHGLRQMRTRSSCRAAPHRVRSCGPARRCRLIVSVNADRPGSPRDAVSFQPPEGRRRADGAVARQHQGAPPREGPTARFRARPERNRHRRRGVHVPDDVTRRGGGEADGRQPGLCGGGGGLLRTGGPRAWRRGRHRRQRVVPGVRARVAVRGPRARSPARADLLDRVVDVRREHPGVHVRRHARASSRSRPAAGT